MTGNTTESRPALRSHHGWKTPNLFSMIVILLLAVNYFSPFADLDYTWQERTGERILQSGKLRTTDAFSYTIAGRRVPDFEWLYEVTLAVIWNAFGYGGLKLLRTLCVGAPLLLMALHLRRSGVRWRGIALALTIAVVVLMGTWNLRPLYCTTISLLVVACRLHDHCTGRRSLPLWLPLILLLWANVHPGVIVGQALLIGAIGWEWLNRLLRLNSPLDRRGLRRLTWIGGLGLAATFLSPDPIERLTYPFQPGVHHPIMRSFVEMRPLCAFVVEAPFTFALVYVVAAVALWTVVRRFRQYRLWEIFLLLGLAVLGNAAFRSVQDWLLVMLALCAPHVARLLRESAASRRKWSAAALLHLDRGLKRVFHLPALRVQGWPVAALAVLAVTSLLPPLSRAMPIQESADWPAAVVDWIDAHGVSGRFFADPNDGAYLTWRLHDRARCYADTRGFFFPPELLEDCQYLPQLTLDWPDRLRRVESYDTDYFLLKTEGPHGALWRAIEPHISDPLYRDQSVVLLRSDQVRAGLAAWEQQLAANP
ncbi:MAG TPA: hypothetical protein VMS17_16635 [Gemmataceae bacterium]|nr:hypothetical protein [Gemmataceae bacterium]